MKSTLFLQKRQFDQMSLYASINVLSKIIEFLYYIHYIELQ